MTSERGWLTWREIREGLTGLLADLEIPFTLEPDGSYTFIYRSTQMTTSLPDEGVGLDITYLLFGTAAWPGARLMRPHVALTARQVTETLDHLARRASKELSRFRAPERLVTESLNGLGIEYTRSESGTFRFVHRSVPMRIRLRKDKHDDIHAQLEIDQDVWKDTMACFDHVDLDDRFTAESAVTRLSATIGTIVEDGQRLAAMTQEAKKQARWLFREAGIPFSEEPPATFRLSTSERSVTARLIRLWPETLIEIAVQHSTFPVTAYRRLALEDGPSKLLKDLGELADRIGVFDLLD